MFQESAAVDRLTDRLSVWLPGSFSVALLALSCIANPLFTGWRIAPMPFYLEMLLIGLLGVRVHMVLLQQRRKIRALEAAMRQIAGGGAR
jgi:hypothetical protein